MLKSKSEAKFAAILMGPCFQGKNMQNTGAKIPGSC